MKYIVKRKQARGPMFVFLSAAVAGEITEATYRGGALIEMLHTATLVHDEWVDDSDDRRGFFSINALWKNKIAVFSLVISFIKKDLLLCSREQRFQDYWKLSQMRCGNERRRIIANEKPGKLNITEEIYFEIIRQKKQH